MVSDFIDEHNGFLALSDEEHDRAKALNPCIHKYSREFLEYGESREGYWTRDKFVSQMHRAIEIAEIKYPKEEGRVGVTYGYLITAAAMLPWLMMLLKLAK